MSQGRFTMLAVALSLGATQAFAGGITNGTVVSTTSTTTLVSRITVINVCRIGFPRSGAATRVFTSSPLRPDAAASS